MLLIKCIFCGERDETEFHYGGELRDKRPLNPNDLSDKEWAEFLYSKRNVNGIHIEQWFHSGGCRQWFNIERNTFTNEITNTFNLKKQKITREKD
ncbi:MAG: sarcosine oxidase subunit delta [Chloroflexi bacterium]|nr:sarcosine oxidase subunit delta [Chloroflexota bacterium]|tara:strand:+ start:7231 stop:7515 length:285 start_codon:yes stop_codon:yes gene_type:complete